MRTDVLISVVIPTFNRAHTLPDAAESLHGQDAPLELIVVDDGSTDDTARVMGELASRSPFPVAYLQREHAGMWAAVNAGVAAAKGEMVALLGSDDMLAPGALGRFAAHWAAIPDKNGFAGVTGLCVDEAGHYVGDRFPADVLDTSWQEMHYRHRPAGEKSGMQRTDILRAYPFPPSQGFESMIWRKIGLRYQTRYVNDVFHIYRTSGSDHLSRTPFARVAETAAVVYSEMLNEDARWFRHAPDAFFEYGAQYARATFHEGTPVHRQAAGLRTWQARALWLTGLPLGWLAYQRDRHRDANVRP